MLRCILTFAFPALLSAADWTQFRGSDLTGVDSKAKPPATFDATSIAWKAPLPGRGLSSPLIISGRVYLTAASGPQQEVLHIMCFRAADGKQLWDREFRATGRTMCHPKTCNAAPTPCSDGKNIYALYSSNDLICLDLDGNLQWLRGLTLDYPNASNSLGLASSPLIADGVLVVQIENDSDSFAAGIDPATGVNKWRLPGAKDANWTSPTIARDPDGKESASVVVTSRKGVIAVDLQTGKERWTLEGGTTIPSSTVSGNILAVPSNGMKVWEIQAGTTPPKMLWESPQVGAGTASPLIIGEHLFAVNNAGVLTCAITQSGDRKWKLRLDGTFSGSPVAAANTIYAVTEKGTLLAVDTKAPEGAISGKLDLGQTVLCTPSLSGNSIYLRSDKTLWKIGQ